MLNLAIQSHALRKASGQRRGSASQQRRPADRFAEGGVEPSLEDLITDPVTAVIMRYDNVTPATLRTLVGRIRAKLLARSARADSAVPE